MTSYGTSLNFSRQNMKIFFIKIWKDIYSTIKKEIWLCNFVYYLTCKKNIDTVWCARLCQTKLTKTFSIGLIPLSKIFLFGTSCLYIDIINLNLGEYINYSNLIILPIDVPIWTNSFWRLIFMFMEKVLFKPKIYYRRRRIRGFRIK